MRTQTVRIAATDHAALSQMARESGQAMSEVLSDAIHELQRNRLLQKTNEAYARLKEDKAAWEQELLERSAWDGALQDGME